MGRTARPVHVPGQVPGHAAAHVPGHVPGHPSGHTPAAAPFRSSFHGPRPIAALIPVVTRPAFRRNIPGAYQLLEAWPGIVGPELAEVTVPRRLFRQTLTIHCLGPVAMELQHVSNALIGRINQYLGAQSVQRLRFLQTLAPRVVAPARPVPSVAAAAAADAAVERVPEGPLRAALASLGRVVLADAAARRPNRVTDSEDPMPIVRRTLLTATGAALLPGLSAILPAMSPGSSSALAQDAPKPAPSQADLARAERSVGSADAKTTVMEFFSLTCSHCAAFAAGTMRKVKTELIETGKVRWVFHDYPLDQIALLAAQVARYLPVERYEPFVDALLSTQDRWAFARGINNAEEIWKTAALAGMSRVTFDKAVADTALREWIIKQQQADTEKWRIDSTPSFVVNGTKTAGEMSFDAFRKLIPES